MSIKKLLARMWLIAAGIAFAAGFIATIYQAVGLRGMLFFGTIVLCMLITFWACGESV